MPDFFLHPVSAQCLHLYPCWTGEADGYGSDARGVDLDRGYDSWDYAAFDYPVAVCLP